MYSRTFYSLAGGFFTFLILLTTCGQVTAQLKFTAVAEQKVVGMNDLLSVEYVVEGVTEAETFTPPVFTPFEVAQGPAYSSGFNSVNGSVSKYFSITYYLKPTSKGKYVLPPATVLVNKQQLRSNSLAVEVVQRSSNAGGGVGGSGTGGVGASNPFAGSAWGVPSPQEDFNDGVLKKNDNASDKIKKNMALRMSVSKNECYVGEPIVATCKLYSRLQSESKVTKRPSFSGFSVFEMMPPEQNSMARENLDGRPYNSYLIRKAQLYPLQSGDLEIEPVEVSNNVTFYRVVPSQKQSGGGPKSLVEQMMNDFWDNQQGVAETHQLALETKPVIVKVKPLPVENKPADFTGAVGHFKVQAVLARTQVKTNETDTLVVTITGSGNFPMVNTPVVSWPKGVEAYDPIAKEELDQSVVPIRGTKTFYYVFTPGQKGTLQIPAVHFSFFSPDSAKYQSLETMPLLLDVQQGKAAPAAVEGTVPQREMKGKEWWFLTAIGLSILIIGLSFLLRKKATGKPAAAAPEVAEQPAAVMPEWERKAMQAVAPVAMSTFREDWLNVPREYLKQQDSSRFYKSLHEGLWQFFQQQLQLQVSEHNKGVILERLQEKGYSVEVQLEVRSLLEGCEVALYAPVHTYADMQQTLEMAERITKRFEHHITG